MTIEYDLKLRPESKIRTRQRKRSLKNNKNLTKKIIDGGKILLASAVLAGIVAFGADYLIKKNEERLSTAFSQNCDYTTINLREYNQFEGQPRMIAREKFIELRDTYPERFETFSNEEGTNQLMKNYDKDTGELKIPRYDCQNSKN